MNKINEKIKKIEDSSIPLISGGKGQCCIRYSKELDKIVIDMIRESITEDIKNQIDIFMNNNNIDNYLIFNNNTAMKNTENYYSFPYLLVDTRGYFKKDPHYAKIDFKLKKERIYNCLNYAEHKHRTIIFNELKERKLLKEGFVSYVDKGVVLSESVDPTLKEKQNPNNTVNDGHVLVTKVIEKSYFSVITETHHEITPDNDGLHITEKTYKALISHPFIIVGQYGHLKKLKEWGFETYPELFDESYDLIENPMERINFIVNEIERLCNMEKNELEKIYKSVIWKVEHNKKIMIEFPIDEFAYKYRENNND